MLYLPFFHYKLTCLRIGLFSLFFTLLFVFLYATPAMAASPNAPSCTLSYSPAKLGPPPATAYLDVGKTTSVQFTGSDPTGTGSYIDMSFTQLAGGSSVVGLPANYQTLAGQNSMLKSFNFQGITAGTARQIQVDFKVMVNSTTSACWSRLNYEITVTSVPQPGFSFIITPVSQSILEGDTAIYNIYTSCNRSFDSSKPIINLSFNPNLFQNITPTFSTTTPVCGNYFVLSISTVSKLRTPANASSPYESFGNPSVPANNFTVSAESNQQSVVSTATVDGELYIWSDVNAFIRVSDNYPYRRNTILVNTSGLIEWYGSYADPNYNSGKPCELFKNGVKLGDRVISVTTDAGQGESTGVITSTQAIRYSITCTGWSGVKRSSTDILHVVSSTSSPHFRVLWALNGAIQTGQLTGISYFLKTSNGMYNTSAFTDAPKNITVDSSRLNRTFALNISGLTNNSYNFLGVIPPGYPFFLSQIPYFMPTNAYFRRSGGFLADSETDSFVLDFATPASCPDFSVAPYNSPDYQVGFANSVSVPSPAAKRNLTVGDAAKLYAHSSLADGTFRSDGSGVAPGGTYNFANGYIVPVSSGTGDSKVRGDTGNWTFSDQNGAQAKNCNLADAVFRINDFSFSQSPLAISTFPGGITTSVLGITSINYFNQPVGFTLVPVSPATWPSNFTLSFCDNNGNNCASAINLTPNIGGTVNGILKLSADVTATPGTYKFKIKAIYSGSYQENSKLSPEFTFTVYLPPTVTITAPTANTNLVYGSNQTVSWTSTNTPTTGTPCTLTNSRTGASIPVAYQGSWQDVNVTSDTSYIITCNGTLGGSDSEQTNVLVIPLPPSNLVAYNSASDPLNHPVTCGDIKLTWGVASGVSGYYLYTSPTGASIATISPESVDTYFYTPPTQTATVYYLASFGNFGSGNKASSRVSIISAISPVASPCPPNFALSDIDILTIDGSDVSNEVPCDGVPSPVLANQPGVKREYVAGAIIKFNYNLCNEGYSDAVGIRPELVLYNLGLPPGGYNFHIECANCGALNNQILTPTGMGTKASPFVFDLTGNTLPAKRNWRIVFEAQAQIPVSSTQSDFYGFVSGLIKGENFSQESLNSSFVHFRISNIPDKKEVQY